MTVGTRHFGCHVSASGGLEQAVINGSTLGVNTIQLHPCPPQRWNYKAFEPGVEDKFLEARESSCVKKVFFHGIYLINLANPDPKQYQNSKTSLLHDVDLIARLKGDGVIFHCGSMKHQPDEEAGFRQIADGINWIMERADNDGRLLLEVAAGSGDIIGDRVEELERIYEGVTQKERVGFALDTQHMWASGYDLQNALEEVVDNIDRALSIDKVWAIHLNDSKTALGSRIDRHENIGDGLIGEEALRRVFLHPRLKHIPFILETPALKDLETAQGEVNKLRGFLR